jgi:hypothetical protein
LLTKNTSSPGRTNTASNPVEDDLVPDLLVVPHICHVDASSCGARSGGDVLPVPVRSTLQGDLAPKTTPNIDGIDAGGVPTIVVAEEDSFLGPTPGYS